jgi:3-deoxy-D-manno-octulosonic-acid transferase
LLTFFSPSGYEVRKNYAGADYIFYLPMDSRKNAFKFIEVAKPRLILFIKYEFWYFYLSEAKKRNIPLLLISGIFRKNQPFFSKYGNFHRNLLSCFTHFFVQNKESFSLLQTIGFKQNITISGDTRFDRVIEIAEQFQPIPAIEKFCNGSEVIVAGSTWTEDDRSISHYANTNNSVKFVIAPHDIKKERLDECLKLYGNSTLFSRLNTLYPSPKINTIIIDNIGMLSRLYKYATIAYVGGGFGAEGVHNVLEAAVYGKPVVFGPVYKKYIEAIELVSNGGGVSVDSALTIKSTFDKLLKKEQNYFSACHAASDYVYSNKGATEIILQFIQAKRLLTN